MATKWIRGYLCKYAKIQVGPLPLYSGGVVPFELAQEIEEDSDEEDSDIEKGKILPRAGTLVSLQ